MVHVYCLFECSVEITWDGSGVNVGCLRHETHTNGELHVRLHGILLNVLSSPHLRTAMKSGPDVSIG